MIKKINFLLVLVSIIGSIFITFNTSDSFILVLKDVSIIVTINLLYIIEKLFNIKISDVSKFCYILFIFMAHFLGVTCDLYTKIYWFDKFVHCLSGVLTSFIAIYILRFNKVKTNIFMNIIFIISFSMLVASLWEVFEYLSSFYFNLDPQKVASTGVNDTMGDIIVAFIGSIFVSFCYYYEDRNKFNGIINKFIKSI